jgi:hypothetical protein
VEGAVKVSTLRHKRDTSPTLHEVEWSAFVDGLLRYEFRADKDGPLFSPAEYDGAGRKAENVRAIHFAVLDLDDITPNAYLEALKKADQFAAFSYTTWSQPEASRSGLFRARLVVALSRPVTREEWPAVWSRLVVFFGATGTDDACKDPCRNYYLPTLPIGCEWAVQTWRSQGSIPLDVDALLRMPAPEHVPAALVPLRATDPITGDMVRRFAERLSKRADPNEARLGNLLRAGLAGEAFAVPGAHDTVLWEIACVLGAQFTTSDPEALASLFRPALSLMAAQSNHPDAPAATAENLAEKISRAQQSAYGARVAKAQEGTVQRNRKIEIAYLGKRSHPYTTEELAQFAQEQAELGGQDPGRAGQAPDLFGRWLVQRGAVAYIFFDGSYVGPFKVRGELAQAAGQFLAPAITAGIELHDTDKNGNVVPKSGESLISQYGRVVETVEADMTSAKAYLAADRHCFVEAPCPINRKLSPVYDPEVAEWLALLGGGKTEALLDWLAAVTMLERPAPALYLKGEASTGKSLLAAGLARIWGQSSAATMRAIMGQFNAQLLRCPLVLADEKVPETWNGQPRTEELRELITATEFRVERKGQEAFTVRGSIRAILAANNLKLISSKEEFTREDALALADRFLFVVPNPSARTWLEGKGGPAFTASLVQGDRIAQHTLWLRQEHEHGRRRIKPGGRLVVPGDANELVQLIQTSGGAAWPALYWLWSFLQDPMVHVRGCAGRPFAALVKDGDLWVSFKRLWESWDHYLGGDRAPSLERLTAASKGVVLPKRDARYQPRNARTAGVTYQRIDLGAFREWVRGIDEDVSQVHKGPGGLLERDTEGLAVQGAGPLGPN